MRLWAGFDVAKAFHWLCVVDEDGLEVLSRRVEATEEGSEPRWRNWWREDPRGEVVRSLPGMGAMLAAEFLAETGESLPLRWRRQARRCRRRQPRAAHVGQHQPQAQIPAG